MSFSDEDFERPKKRQKSNSSEPVVPAYTSPRVRCCCEKFHNSHFKGNCPTNCYDEEYGIQYPLGECPTCECPCNKVTLLTNVNKVLNQKKMASNPKLQARMSVVKQTAQYLQTGEKVRKNAGKQLQASYQKSISDGKVSKSSAKGNIKRAIKIHASRFVLQGSSHCDKSSKP